MVIIEKIRSFLISVHLETPSPLPWRPLARRADASERRGLGGEGPGSLNLVKRQGKEEWIFTGS
jgi:hypothetical protein